MVAEAGLVAGAGVAAAVAGMEPAVRAAARA
jgi:hypothetical protein